MSTYSVIKSGHISSNKQSFQASPKEEINQCEETVEHLHTQLATLMNSLATLSAEKSRMEASFQADKKQLRFEKEEVLLKHFKP
jgi:chromosome segregation ATPase